MLTLLPGVCPSIITVCWGIDSTRLRALWVVHEIWGKSGYLLCHSMKLMMMMTVIVLDVCHSACVVSLSRPARSAAFRSLSCQSLVKGLKKKRDSDTDSMNLTFWIGASMLQNEKKQNNKLWILSYKQGHRPPHPTPLPQIAAVPSSSCIFARAKQ